MLNLNHKNVYLIKNKIEINIKLMICSPSDYFLWRGGICRVVWSLLGSRRCSFCFLIHLKANFQPNIPFKIQIQIALKF
jgi:hypothetical protein